MPKLPDKKPECVACGDTRRNSKDGDCHPCFMAGRITAAQVIERIQNPAARIDEAAVKPIRKKLEL